MINIHPDGFVFIKGKDYYNLVLFEGAIKGAVEGAKNRRKINENKERIYKRTARENIQ